MSAQNQSVETLRWLGGKLEMIDQRMLPARFEYLAYTSVAETSEPTPFYGIRIGCDCCMVTG